MLLNLHFFKPQNVGLDSDFTGVAILGIESSEGRVHRKMPIEYGSLQGHFELFSA